MTDSEELEHGKPTAQSDAIEVRTAGMFRRALAASVDLLLPWTLALLVLALYPDPDVMEGSIWNAWDRFIDGYNADSGLVFVPWATLLVGALAWRLAFALRGKESPGARFLGLRTIGRDGLEATVRARGIQALWRIPSALLLMGGHLWLLADPERRTLHDRLAGLYMIQKIEAENHAPARPIPEPDAEPAPGPLPEVV